MRFIDLLSPVSERLERDRIGYSFLELTMDSKDKTLWKRQKGLQQIN